MALLAGLNILDLIYKLRDEQDEVLQAQCEQFLDKMSDSETEEEAGPENDHLKMFSSIFSKVGQLLKLKLKFI